MKILLILYILLYSTLSYSHFFKLSDYFYDNTLYYSYNYVKSENDTPLIDSESVLEFTNKIYYKSNLLFNFTLTDEHYENNLKDYYIEYINENENNNFKLKLGVDTTYYGFFKNNQNIEHSYLVSLPQNVYRNSYIHSGLENIRGLSFKYNFTIDKFHHELYLGIGKPIQHNNNESLSKILIGIPSNYLYEEFNKHTNISYRISYNNTVEFFYSIAQYDLTFYKGIDYKKDLIPMLDYILMDDTLSISVKRYGMNFNTDRNRTILEFFNILLKSDSPAFKSNKETGFYLINQYSFDNKYMFSLGYYYNKEHSAPYHETKYYNLTLVKLFDDFALGVELLNIKGRYHNKDKGYIENKNSSNQLTIKFEYKY